MFSSKRFIVLALTLGSTIHLELIFMHHIGKGFNFVLLHVNILLFQYHLLKRLSFPHWMNLATLCKNQLTINIRIYFWILNSVPSFQVLPVLHWLDYCSFVVRFWNWKAWVLQLCSPLSRLLWLCRPLAFLHDFQDYDTEFCGWLHCHWLEEGSQFVHLFLNRRFRSKTFQQECYRGVLVISRGITQGSKMSGCPGTGSFQATSTGLRSWFPDCPTAKWCLSLCK